MSQGFHCKDRTIFGAATLKCGLSLRAILLISGGKKEISANQLHRTLGVTWNTAWFMSHRIREAMSSDGVVDFGSGGGIVEVDETFIGKQYEKPKGARGGDHKNKMLTLVDRTTGRAKAIVVQDLKVSTLLPILRENIAPEAIVYTDEARQYSKLSDSFADHDFTTHSRGEYVRGIVHTNTVEGYFSVFKRGMKGVYQHCNKRHLHRYAAEFEFRYNNRIANGVNDAARAATVLGSVVGKRLLYRDSSAL